MEERRCGDAAKPYRLRQRSNRVQEVKDLKDLLVLWGMSDWQAINTALRLLYLPYQLEFIVFPEGALKKTS